MRPLGTAHGGVEASCFLRALTQICYSSAELGTSLKRVHLLLASHGDLSRSEEILRRLLGRRS